jgi:hypothetical protein
MKEIKFSRVRINQEDYFSSSYCNFTHLYPSQHWSGYTIICTKADGSQREIKVPKFDKLLDGHFEENGRIVSRLEVFNFDDADELTIQLPDDTNFNFPSYCCELATIESSFEANKRIEFVVTEYNGRHFFECVIGPQVFVFDEFSAVPFYYASYTHGELIRDSKSICSFYARDHGGMDCYYHYFSGLKAEFSTQSQEKGRREFDKISASRLQIGDRISLKSDHSLVTMLAREWARETRSHGYNVQSAAMQPVIPKISGRFVMDYASQPK